MKISAFPDPKGIRLTLPTRHRDIAELVGASRPRITEHLIAFERKHLISRNSRQLVVNRDRLEGFLAQTHIAAAAPSNGKAAQFALCLAGDEGLLASPTVPVLPF